LMKTLIQNCGLGRRQFLLAEGAKPRSTAGPFFLSG
jgi:hypothetical protein